jgi:hypothetical protein
MACRSKGPRFVCLIVAGNLMGVGYASTETGGMMYCMGCRSRGPRFVCHSVADNCKGVEYEKIETGEGRYDVRRDVLGIRALQFTNNHRRMASPS